MKQKNQPPSKSVIEQMQKFYDEGHSLQETQEKFDWSRPTLIRYLKTRAPQNISDEERKQRNINKVVSWRRRLKEKLLDIFGRKCPVCNYDKCVENLTFHHRNPEQKEFQISGMTKSADAVMKEAEKCKLLCKNCHGEVHGGLWKNNVWITGDAKDLVKVYYALSSCGIESFERSVGANWNYKYGYDHIPHEETICSVGCSCSDEKLEKVKILLSQYNNLKWQLL